VSLARLTKLKAGLFLSTLLVGKDLSGDFLDHTDGNGLAHITHGETSEGRVVGEGLNDHGLGGSAGHHAGITALDECGVLLNGLTGTTIDLGVNLLELGGDVAGVAIEHRSVTIDNLARVGHDDHLGGEGLGSLGRVVLGVGAHESTLDVLDRDVLAVESDVVTGDSLEELLVVHLDRLDFSLEADGAEGDDHTRLQDTGLDTAHGHCANTTDLVHVLKGKTQRLVGGSLGLLDLIKGLQEDGTLVPGHLVGALNHVVADPTGDGDEVHLGGLVSDLLQVAGNLLLDIVVTSLRVVSRVHLVEGNDHLRYTKSEGKQSVLLGLAIGGPSTLESTGGRVDDKDGTIGLGSTSDHVLDEITMAGGINDGERILGGLELPKSDIDGDTTLALGLEVIKNPSILERRFTHFGSLLLELLDGTLVDATALVDQVTGGGRLTSIDVADDDERNVDLKEQITRKCTETN
jgi:hypothetical protein